METAARHTERDVTRADWAAVYALHGPRLLRYLSRFARNREDAEELMHEAFTRGMSAARSPSEPAERTYWLFRIATNVALDHLRRARRFRWVPLFSGEVPDSTGAFAESDIVRSALKSIPPEHSVVLVLRIQEGYSREEIAKILGLSEVAVKSRLFRARANFVSAYRRLGGTTR